MTHALWDQPLMHADHDRPQLRPWADNPRYWSYGGRPVLLVGASDEDNLFQLPELEAQLDRLHAAGGNVVRCTMSSRDPGDEHPFAKNADGLYDLERFNPAYWEKFESLLRMGEQRGIFVQIEVWDRFDYSREFWQECSFNPDNNVNYTFEETGLEPEYPEHPARCLQPFFHTVPAMKDNAALRVWQERFVEQMLSISLKYSNVLYCMSNETHEDPAWGAYWIRFIQALAKEAGAEVYATDMFDGDWNTGLPESTRMQFEDPALYAYLDTSQLSAWRVHFEEQWANLMRLRRANQQSSRPINCTKVYGADTLPRHPEGVARAGTTAGVAGLLLNLMGGCASARFHRPPSGLGLSDVAVNVIRSVRRMESRVPLWDWTPVEEPLATDRGGPAFAVELGEPGRGDVLVLYPEGGAVVPDKALGRRFAGLTWVDPVIDQDWDRRELAPGERLGGNVGRPVLAWLHV